jgi:hypothetical protein
MAINVDTVYKTVLLLLNKEQRGYMTPTEFNSVATQVQLEMFEKYFEDLNQQLRIPQADVDYADRIASIDENIAVFKTFGAAVYDGTTTPLTPYFYIPSTDGFGNTVIMYKLGDIAYAPSSGYPVEVERLQRNTFYNIEKSNLTRSSKSFPTYLYENNKIFVNPKTITSSLEVNYVRKPKDIIWGFNVNPTLGNYVYNPSQYSASTQPTGSQQFELMPSEQTTVILKVLMYAGLIIEDPTVIQVAAQQVQSKEINKKS